jgi:hypothetical protein
MDKLLIDAHARSHTENVHVIDQLILSIRVFHHVVIGNSFTTNRYSQDNDSGKNPRESRRVRNRSIRTLSSGLSSTRLIH